MAAWDPIQFGGKLKSVEIQGYREVTEFFQTLPEAHQNWIIAKSFRKGANVFKKQVAAQTPVRAKKMNKALSVKAKGTMMTVGYFANKGVFVNNRGTSWDLYQLMYWFNYGTLGRRDSSHNFTRPRSYSTANWSGGIRPRRFVETAWEQSKTQVMRSINDTILAETLKLMEKNVVK